MRQLPLPFTVSGLLPARLPQVSRRLGLGQAMSGSPGGTAAASIPVVAGGNMAASLSYGTVTSSALGTATLVCGSQVVGFGHPFDFTGPTNLTLHGASTVLIQDDSTGSGFNVANLGAPVGTVDNDRLAGIHAVTGPPPTSAAYELV